MGKCNFPRLSLSCSPRKGRAPTFLWPYFGRRYRALGKRRTPFAPTGRPPTPSSLALTPPARGSSPPAPARGPRPSPRRPAPVPHSPAGLRCSPSGSGPEGGLLVGGRRPSGCLSPAPLPGTAAGCDAGSSPPLLGARWRRGLAESAPSWPSRTSSAGHCGGRGPRSFFFF